jgi:hypothetical protein
MSGYSREERQYRTFHGDAAASIAAWLEAHGRDGRTVMTAGGTLHSACPVHRQ